MDIYGSRHCDVCFFCVQNQERGNILIVVKVYIFYYVRRSVVGIMRRGRKRGISFLAEEGYGPLRVIRRKANKTVRCICKTRRRMTWDGESKNAFYSQAPAFGFCRSDYRLLLISGVAVDTSGGLFQTHRQIAASMYRWIPGRSSAAVQRSCMRR